MENTLSCTPPETLLSCKGMAGWGQGEHDGIPNKMTIHMQCAGDGSSWLYPFVDGHPPIGWDDASRYLVLPVLLVVFQFVSTALISPPVQQEEEQQNPAVQKALTIFLPFMVGWFSLNLPAGLSLYYFSNITLTSAQQIWLRKLGGMDFWPEFFSS